MNFLFTTVYIWYRVCLVSSKVLIEGVCIMFHAIWTHEVEEI